MISRFFHVIAAPFVAYYDLTIAEPCREVSQCAKSKAHEKKVENSAKPQFSFINHIRKQREMTSPRLDGTVKVTSPRRHYIRDTHTAAESQSWLH